MRDELSALGDASRPIGVGRPVHRPPKYGLHKGSGQAIVSINGRRLYRGVYGTPKCHELYGNAISESRRSLTGRSRPQKPAKQYSLSNDDLLITASMLHGRRQAGREATINELIFVYRKHTHVYCRKNDNVTREAMIIDEVLRFMDEHHGPCLFPVLASILKLFDATRPLNFTPCPTYQPSDRWWIEATRIELKTTSRAEVGSGIGVA